MVDATKQIDKFNEFIEVTYKDILPELIKKEKKSLVIDFGVLAKHDHNLAEELLEEPEETIKAAEYALSQFDLKETFRVRFFNLPESQKTIIRDIRAKDLGRFMFFEGIVRQSSDIRPQAISVRFECPSCSQKITIIQFEKKMKKPTKCSCGRRGHFTQLGKDLVDLQRIVVEEASEDLDGGAQPKRFTVFLREDLVEPKMEKRTTPGTKVRVTGIVSEIVQVLPSGEATTLFDLVMNANFIEPVQEDFSEVQIDKKEEEEIINLSKDPKLFETLISSIAPSILGHNMIKEGLLLQLVGGVRKKKQDNTLVRGDLHILLVGDPGAGKSQMLSFIAKAAPKARYVVGRGSSGAGLTAAVVKDEFLKGWALEAGAIVLANKGIVVLDELDKMSDEDTSALHEGMEQQTITIAKANIQATLRCQTTVLAAANPKYGRFDVYKPLGKQIDMPPALISRFDLIFPIRDLPDKIKDEKIATHILSQHQNIKSMEKVIEPEFLRKYISYCKQKISPKLSKTAVKAIKEFYVNLRNTYTGGDEKGVKPVPITARYLEALIRLTEASAKLRLSEDITKSDAKRAIRLLQYCMSQIGVDPETGQLDVDVIQTGVTSSKRSKIGTILHIIDEAAEKGQKTIAIEDIISEAEDKGLDRRTADEIIEKLKKEGEIFEPKAGFIQKID
ncbi:MAG: minichromosome maintenance protein MCM [Nanoarchaeota archaeon]|nr:minichromosome maintenance protein MCM [Nanoarchaeota archaeon]